MKVFWSVYAPAALFVAVSAVLYLWHAPLEYLTAIVEGHGVASYATFVGLLFGATVFMPITVLPIIPMVSPVFGPFTTGMLSVVGWTAGAAAAFLIARYLGRPIVSKFVSLEKLDRAIERIPSSARFFTIVVIRMSLPVDIMSYALGFVRTIRFVPYVIATTLGVTWFSFAFAYLGDALVTHDRRLFLAVAGASIVLFLACWGILLARLRKRDGED